MLLKSNHVIVIFKEKYLKIQKDKEKHVVDSALCILKKKFLFIEQSYIVITNVI